PRREDISAFSGREGLEPVRVYVGLRSAATPEARAKLALEELKRVGGFERSVLIVVTPTGTGWGDPAAIDHVGYLPDGAVASVALQYSYLASWLSLLVEPGYGADAARALFNEIYGYWITLPKDNRPRLYLHGLSLGAMNSEQSTDLIEVLGDPFAGALWSGPPYSSRLWRFLTERRNPGSPASLPRRIVRPLLDPARRGRRPRLGFGCRVGADAGRLPPICERPRDLFRLSQLLSRTGLDAAPRGPDVSPQLRWYPAVTLLQLT